MGAVFLFMKLTGIVCTVAVVAALLSAPVVNAQEKLPATYRLNFRILESGVVVGADSKAAVTRNYVLIVQSKSRGRIDASRRLPYYTSSKGEAKELHTAALGSIIECTPEDKEPGGVRLDCAFESSYVAPDQPEGQRPPIGFLPVINARKFSTAALIAIGPEVRIASLDEPSGRQRLELFVSVERLSGPVGATAAE